MPALAAWKLLVPVGGVVLIGIFLVRSGDVATQGKLATPATTTRTSTLGYLRPQEFPNGAAQLPPPPQPGSAAMKRDEEARSAALQLRGSPRYVLATADADREQSKTAAAFQCALGIEINEQRTPSLYRLLARVRLDVRAASYPAKSHFKRPRPFAVFNTHTCYPPDEQNVRDDGSYPSARGAVGWAYALVLAELDPARSSEILERGRAFGQSRIICDEEWLSDVDAGNKMAEATLRNIHDKPAFRADFGAARKEIAAASKSGVRPPSCQSEALALASP
jgi:acid phosphatase (class A)